MSVSDCLFVSIGSIPYCPNMQPFPTGILSLSALHSSRDRDYDRDRDRRPSEPAPASAPAPTPAASAASDAAHQARIQALAAMQQQQLQQQLLAQQLLLQQQQQLAGQAAAQQSNKKQREVYVGNLTIGVVNEMMLRELFNGALASLVPDPQTNPPVVNCQLDPTGRFGFVELRSEELATSAMSLDKVDLCGRSINVGRPKGYVEPIGGPARAAQPVAQVGLGALPGPPLAAAVPTAPPPTCNLLLLNLLHVKELREDDERADIVEDVKEECHKDGRQVIAITCPKPPAAVPDLDPGRVYVKFETPGQCKSAHALMHGRQFDGNAVEAKYVSDEQFTLAQGGSWLDHSAQPVAAAAGPAMPSLSGPPSAAMAAAAATAAAMVPGGMPDVAASAAHPAANNPQLAALLQSNPQLAAVMGVKLG
mmetsp:Transcript_20762/g.57644  ORF Transcript_20762/g.57644 Transcript_20762/m.57644 type:complete len:422 (+) Transcript_20762:392-1657(+)